MSDEIIPDESQTTSLMGKVFALVRACPVGRVTTYGWISKALGYPRGARMIGYIMRETPPGVPAQRVINSKGELSGSFAFGQKGRMHQLLESEGITFSEEERVDLKRYGWDPLHDLSEEELQHILDEASDTDIEVSPRLRYLINNDAASPLRKN